MCSRLKRRKSIKLLMSAKARLGQYKVLSISCYQDIFSKDTCAFSRKDDAQTYSTHYKVMDQAEEGAITELGHLQS